LAKREPDLVDARLTRALEHPIRLEILGVLNEGPSSPARIQRQLDNVSLNLVAHHMKVLKSLGCVELVETVSKRGAREHIYRIAGSLIVSAEEWEKLSPEVRQPFTGTVLRMVSEELAESLLAGKFDALPDSHLSRTPLRLDQEGWKDIVDVLARGLDEVLAIKKQSLERIEAGAEELTPATVAILQFPTVEP